MAKILRSRMFYGSAAELQGQLAQQAAELIEVHQFKGDSTHQQAVEKSKVHTSLVSSSFVVVSAEDFDLGGYMLNVEKLQSIASAMKTVGDLQPVVEGTGAEPYGFVLKVMENVGCPSWLSRLGESKANPDRLSVYLFCFDAGGECQSHLRRVHLDFAVAALGSSAYSTKVI